MRLKDYLQKLSVSSDPKQQEWDSKLEEKVALFQGTQERPQLLYKEFDNRVRTEEIKAWYSTPEPGDLFQGTSVSSLVIPATFRQPLNMSDIRQLEETIAEEYISAHNKYAKAVQSAIVEPVDQWIQEGLFYGAVIPSKVIAQAFNLTVDTDSLVVDIEGVRVDPHEITSYDPEIREKYFSRTKTTIGCLADIDLSRVEFESSLALSDVSKPNMERYKNKGLLGPVRCNEIAALLGRQVKELIKEKSKGRITPKSLEVVICDTDTPYTYHQIIGHNGDPDAPCLPGLTVLGASGSIDAFRWLYAYRVSLIAQKIMKGSLYSQTKSSFMPFVFMGVLVPRDAEILLDMDRLDLLRYRGNISPKIEFAYLANSLLKYIGSGSMVKDKKGETCVLSD